MIINLFLVVSIMMYLVILSSFYFHFKVMEGLLNFQQSAYDEHRYLKFIKSSNRVFGFHELLPIFILIVLYCTNVNYIILLLFIIVILTYNLRFFNLVKKRYNKKIGLNLTPRVKRQIIVFYILNILEFILIVTCAGSKVDLLFILFVLTFIIYVNIILASLILNPFEKRIKTRFKLKAVNKLNTMSDVNVIGITGSFGKTSIKNIIGHVLGEHERTLITPESYNTPMGLTITINKFLSPFHQNFIAEMGAYYEGEIQELCDMVSPSVGVVSSVGPQHLETFKTIGTITKTKMELIESLPSDGLGILNLDNEYIKNYKIKNDVLVKWYSLKDETADIFAYDIKYVDGIMIFKIKFNGNIHLIESNLLGQHNVENILAAILVSDYKGIEIQEIINSISTLKPIKNRLELNKLNKNLYILNDAFNSNPVGIYEALNILNSFENKIKIVITPGLIDLGSITHEFHVKLGEDLISLAEYIYIVGNTNKKDLKFGAVNSQKQLTNYFEVDNFLEAYDMATKIDGEKVILIANDLPDKFN